MEELVRNIEYLNYELPYCKDTGKVLMKLFDSVEAFHEALQIEI